MYEIIFTTFKKSDSFYKVGFILGIYRILGMATFILAIMMTMDETD